jgi:hypothetical protein
MIHRALLASCFAILSASHALAAGPWVKGYVVSFYDPAFRYGGRADYSRGAEIEPGVDCPHGSTTHFAIPAQVARTFSLVPWRTPQEVEAIAHPPADGLQRDSAGVYFHTWRSASAYRGYRPDIETYINPFAAEDPGQPQVTSRIGEGFNLDGKIKPTDFVSPDGEKGIDNQLYRAWGCDAPWRGANGAGTLVLRSNDKMIGGLYTIVIRISGHQDPRNDSNATLEIGYSPDQIMRDARGNVGFDYSYRILESDQYTRLKATIKDGVVETAQAPEIHMPQIAWFYNQQRDAFFRHGKIRVVLNPDGTAAGLVGGYRDWRDVYTQNVFTQSGGVQGVREHEDHVALYYALRRHADGMFNARTGRYDGISTAYRMKLVPAFVVDGGKPVDLPARAGDDLWRRKAFDETAAAMIKAVDTLVPQDVPPASGELAAVDGIEIGPRGVPLRGRERRGYGRDRAADEKAPARPDLR